jgi:class 3 adenylate cyclase
LAPTIDHGRYIADHVADARLIELPGNDVIPFIGDLDSLVDEIQEFITGNRYGPTPERVLATIVFTDIVDSTGTAARMGDRPWTQVLADHGALVRRQIEHFEGQLVKDTGDGALAIFDGPTRAIRYALMIREGASHLGIQVRAGLHAGEVERRGHDVSGIAVHVAARVVAEAEVGEVMVTNTVVDLVEGSGVSFADRGDRELKGVPGHRHLWSVTGA